MLNTKKAFSSFSVNDIQKAKDFYGNTLGLELSSGPEGTLLLPFSGGTKALMYSKPNHQPATFTVLNFPVESVEKTVDELSSVACDLRSITNPALRRMRTESLAAMDQPSHGSRILQGIFCRLWKRLKPVMRFFILSLG